MHGRYQSAGIGRLVDMLQQWLRCEKYYAKILNPITLWPFQSRPSCIVSGNFFVQFHFLSHVSEIYAQQTGYSGKKSHTIYDSSHNADERDHSTLIKF